jgi:hypothetical protein
MLPVPQANILSPTITFFGLSAPFILEAVSSSSLHLSSQSSYCSSRVQHDPPHTTDDNMLVDPTKSGTALFRPFFTISHCFRNRPAAVRAPYNYLLNSILSAPSVRDSAFSALFLVIVLDPHLLDPWRTLKPYAVPARSLFLVTRLSPFFLCVCLVYRFFSEAAILELLPYTRGPLSLRRTHKYHLWLPRVHARTSTHLS